MTDNEVIKALELCIRGDEGDCLLCPLHDVEACTYEIEILALDLINRQKEEIEELKVKCDSLRSAGNSLKMHYEKAEAEIERLQSVNADMQESLRLAAEANKDMQAEVERLQALVKERSEVSIGEIAEVVDRARADIRAEAIKEFAERLKRNEGRRGVPIATIDRLAKEMTEDCPDCRHFVGCEDVVGGKACELFERSEGK